MNIDEFASKKNRELTGDGSPPAETISTSGCTAGITPTKLHSIRMRDLRQRLRGVAFEAQHPERIYVPKASSAIGTAEH